VTPIVSEESYETKPSIQARQTLPSFASQKDPPRSEATKSLATITIDDRSKIHDASPTLSEVSSQKPQPDNMTEAKESSGGIKQWYR
jgi:hypothetical protein